jgi:hypothetical protein
MWGWYRDHLEELERLHPVHYERVIASILPVGGIGKETELKDFFKEYMAKKPRAKDAIKLSLERLSINVKMRKDGH